MPVNNKLPVDQQSCWNRAFEKQKRKGWEMAVRIEKIIATVLSEVNERQV